MQPPVETPASRASVSTANLRPERQVLESQEGRQSLKALFTANRRLTKLTCSRRCSVIEFGKRPFGKTPRMSRRGHLDAAGFEVPGEGKTCPLQMRNRRGHRPTGTTDR